MAVKAKIETSSDKVNKYTNNHVNIDSLIKDINNKFGDNAIRKAKEVPELGFLRVSTGSLSLDVALGGGIPFGRLVVYAGEFSACKSAMAYRVIAYMQKILGKKKVEHKNFKNGIWIPCLKSEEGSEPLVCALIQSESHSYTNEWAERLGVDVDNLLFIQPGLMEEALDIAIELQKSGGVDLIVHDSYTAYVPQKVVDSSTGEEVQMGVKAKRMGEFHAKYLAYNNYLARSGRIPTITLAISQLRDKIGTYLGGKTAATGGKSAGYTESIEVWFSKGDVITKGGVPLKKGGKVIGQVVNFKVVKNKVGMPHGTGSFDFYFEDGGPVRAGEIDSVKELVIEAVNCDIISLQGAWCYYEGKSIAQGKDKLVEMLRENLEMYNEIKEKTYKLMSEKINLESKDAGVEEKIEGNDESKKKLSFKLKRS